MLVTINVFDCFRRMTALKSEINSRWCSDFLTYSNFNSVTRLLTEFPFPSIIFSLTDINIPTDLLIFSLIYLLADLRTQAYIRIRTYFLFIHSITYSLIHSLNHSHTYSLAYSLTNMVNHSITCFSLIHLSTYSLMLHVFTYFSIH